MAAELNEVEGPDADGLSPAAAPMVRDPDTQTPADWTTLFGQVVLIPRSHEASWPRRGGSGAPSGRGGPLFRKVPAHRPLAPEVVRTDAQQQSART